MASKCSVKVKAWPRWKFRVDWKVPYSFSLKHCSKLFETRVTSPKLSTLQANPTALANCDQRPPPWHARKGQAEHCHIYQHEVLWASPKAWLQMHALIVILCFTPHSSALRWAFAMSSTCSWSPSSLGVSLLDHMKWRISTLRVLPYPLRIRIILDLTYVCMAPPQDTARDYTFTARIRNAASPARWNSFSSLSSPPPWAMNLCHGSNKCSNH